MKTKNKVGNILFVVLLVILLAIMLLLITGHRLFYVKTSSMEPEIPKWSLVIDKTYKTSEEFYKNVKVNDDITFRTDSGNVVTHRIIYIDPQNDIIITQGIRENAAVDSSISFDNVLGAVQFSIPCLGFLVMIIQTWYFWIMLVCIVLCYYLIKALIIENKK